MGAGKKANRPAVANAVEKTDGALVVDGIEVNVAAEDFDDFEITECMAALSDPHAEDGERLTATVRMFRLVFKGDYRRIKDELRAKHGGRLSNECMGDFLNRVIEAAKAKN